MDPHFASLVEKFAPKLEELRTVPPLEYGRLPLTMPLRGVYLFSDPNDARLHLYVGRSNSMRARYHRHCRPGATHRQAAFAFKLARQATGYTDATYAEIGGREWLMQQPAFSQAFVAAKARIRKMEYRYVEESNPTGQALLEIYCATVLRTPYNDFDTH